MKNKRVVRFDGFESLHGWEESVMWTLEEMDIPGDFTGTLLITLEFIPSACDLMGEINEDIMNAIGDEADFMTTLMKEMK